MRKGDSCLKSAEQGTPRPQVSRQVVKTEIAAALRRLQAQRPDAHPFTLAILLQVETGTVISGLQARKLLEVDAG